MRNNIPDDHQIFNEDTWNTFNGKISEITEIFKQKKKENAIIWPEFDALIRYSFRDDKFSYVLKYLIPFDPTTLFVQENFDDFGSWESAPEYLDEFRIQDEVIKDIPKIKQLYTDYDDEYYHHIEIIDFKTTDKEYDIKEQITEFLRVSTQK